MTLGQHDYEELRSSFYHWMTQFFFVLFLILVPILLLNMLIAMMANTYSEVYRCSFTNQHAIDEKAMKASV